MVTEHAPPNILFVHSLNRHRGSYLVDVLVNGTACEAIVDCGAAITIIGRKLWDLMDEDSVKPLRSKFVKTVSGELLPVISETDVVFNFGKHRVRHEVWIVDIAEDCIIGNDFLKEHGCVIDFVNNKLRVSRDKVVRIRNESEPIRETFKVCATKQIEIDSRTETIVYGECEGNPEGLLLLEGALHQNDLLTARTLVDPQQSCVPVRIMNTAEETCVIPAGTTIALGHVVKLADTSVTRPTFQASTREIPSHLEHVFSNVSQELTEDEKNAFAKFLIENSDVFSPESGVTGRTNLAMHRIDTGHHRPIKIPPRKIPLAKRECVDEMIQQMHNNGIIEPSKSPWCAPVVLVNKKDGTQRFCIDYRKLNDVTKKDSYPLPRIDLTLDALGGSKWFTTIDLQSGFWQVEMDAKDREKTAFSAGKELWQFSVMPFGLCNSPATFQRLMELVFNGLSWRYCLIYMDDARYV